MGFGHQQGVYAAHGLTTFPVGSDKTPAVKHYQKIGSRYSRELAGRPEFQVANVGLMAGAKNGLTILDIDAPDDRLLADSLARHGSTPIVCKTASGKFHAWYRHNGERRRIRPDASKPVDILGGGFAVVPDSISNGGRYEFIQGGLDDLGRLPVMRGLDGLPGFAPVQTVQEGSRTMSLFRALRDHATLNPGSSDGELLAFASNWNAAHCSPPLTAGEVANQVTGVMKLQAEGRCWSSEQYLPRMRADLLDLSPDAFWLLNKLSAAHWNRENFIFALRSFAGALGWGESRLRNARDELEQRQVIVCIEPGCQRQRKAPVYRLNQL